MVRYKKSYLTKTKIVKKSILFLILTLGGLFLINHLSAQDNNNLERKFVYKGKILFKESNSNTINFGIEDKLEGYFVLFLFNNQNKKNNASLSKNGYLLKDILKNRIDPNLNFSNLNDSTFLINFSIKKLKKGRILFAVLRTAYDAEKKMNCKIKLE